jgi:hypothetical protein
MGGSSLSGFTRGGRSSAECGDLAWLSNATNWVSFILEYIVASEDVFGDDGLTLDGVIATSDELSPPAASELAEAHPHNLELPNASLLNVIADAAQELSMMLGAHDLSPPASPNDFDANSTESQTPLEMPTEPIRLVDENGVPWYYCTHCWKNHVKKGRARDCANAAFKLHPYKCSGQCGDASWFVHNFGDAVVDHQTATVQKHSLPRPSCFDTRKMGESTVPTGTQLYILRE